MQANIVPDRQLSMRYRNWQRQTKGFGLKKQEGLIGIEEGSDRKPFIVQIRGTIVS